MCWPGRASWPRRSEHGRPFERVGQGHPRAGRPDNPGDRQRQRRQDPRIRQPAGGVPAGDPAPARGPGGGGNRRHLCRQCPAEGDRRGPGHRPVGPRRRFGPGRHGPGRRPGGAIGPLRRQRSGPHRPAAGGPGWGQPGAPTGRPGPGPQRQLHRGLSPGQPGWRGGAGRGRPLPRHDPGGRPR